MTLADARFIFPLGAIGTNEAPELLLCAGVIGLAPSQSDGLAPAVSTARPLWLRGRSSHCRPGRSLARAICVCVDPSGRRGQSSTVGIRQDLAEVFAPRPAGNTTMICERRSIEDVNEAMADVLSAAVFPSASAASSDAPADLLR